MMTLKLARTIGLGVLVMAVGCGGGGGSASGGGLGSRAYVGTQAPGDVWNWTISAGTFTATNETKGFTYSGIETVLSTGFMKLQITSTTDPDTPVDASAYALEFPGTALLIKPAGDDSKPPIMACALGGAPQDPSIAFNFVTVPDPAWSLASPAYGVASLNRNGNQYSGTIDKYLLNGTLHDSSQGSFTYSGGMITVSDPAGVTAGMTPSGVFVLDFGPNKGGVVGVKQPGSDIDLTDLAGKNFHGFLSAQAKTQCIRATTNGDGTLHGMGYAPNGGVETGTSDNGSGVTVTFTSQPAHGEVLIDLTTSGGTESMVACVSQVGGKYMLFGFGKGNGGQQDPPYNFMLVQD